eukprot:scaffold1809_cov386-Prasinococcus_capsulatus_cf.AAC.3
MHPCQLPQPPRSASIDGLDGYPAARDPCRTSNTRIPRTCPCIGNPKEQMRLTEHGALQHRHPGYYQDLRSPLFRRSRTPCMSSSSASFSRAQFQPQWVWSTRQVMGPSKWIPRQKPSSVWRAANDSQAREGPLPKINLAFGSSRSKRW